MTIYGHDELKEKGHEFRPSRITELGIQEQREINGGVDPVTWVIVGLLLFGICKNAY